MKVKIYTIGKVTQDFVLSGEREYLKRLPKNFKIELIEIPWNKKLDSEKQTKDQQTQALLAKIAAKDFLVVLDERGKQFGSVEFAGILSKKFTSGVSEISFAIGGAGGWADEIYKRANLLLSLSQMTLPHQMVRLLLIEQIYRAYSILNGMPYHKS